MPASETNPQPRALLTEARIFLKLSQQEVADRIGTTDVNISRWERGLTRPGPYFRQRLCAFFGKSEQELDLLATEKWVATKMSTLQTQQVQRNQRGQQAQQAQQVAPLDSSVAMNAQEHEVSAGVSENRRASGVYDPFIPRPAAIALVGRDKELEQLKRYLRAHGSGGSVALTALNGLPGVGKTALSIALAHDVDIRKHFYDGILWAGLGPQPDISSLLSHWCRVLELPEVEMGTANSNEARARALRGVIGTRRMLLVIDDAWKIEHALMFKVGGPNCAHLVTTRFPALAAHFAPSGAVGIKELEKEESIKLLQLLAPEVMQREAQKAQELIEAVGGLPLALTVIGNYLRVQAATGSTRRIHAAIKRLSSAEERLQLSEPQAPAEAHSSLSPSMHLSLTSVFAVTDQWLNEQERKAFHALSIFPAKPNSFSEDAALAVADCTLDTLDRLSETGLLENNGEDRYTLHQTVADYAYTQLADNDYAPYERLMTHVMHYVEAHKKDYELLERENTIILAALETAYERGKAVELTRIMLAFAPYLISRGLYDLADRHLQRAYEAAQTLKDSHTIISVLLFRGRIAQKQGEYVQAGQYMQWGLDEARESEDRKAICSALTDLGAMTWKQGEYAQAEAYLQEALNIARELKQGWRLCIILELLGSIAARKGEYTEAEERLQEALAIADRMRDREQICAILNTLGTVVGEQGNHMQAEKYFKKGEVLARQIGHREWLSNLLSNLGDIASVRGDYIEAEKYLEEGLVLVRQSNHRELMSLLLINLGLIARKQKYYVQAERYLQESLILAGQIGIPQITAHGLYEYGNVCLEQQLLDRAEKTFQEMLSITPEGSQDLKALAKYGLARTVGAYGNTSQARELGESSVRALEKMGHRSTMEVKSWLEALTNG